MFPKQQPRVIPCLLLRNTGLVKTLRFKNPTYLGDPRNVVKIFNDKEADELVLLDITASREGRPPRLDLIREIASESFMPMAYGGGIRTIEEVRQIIAMGIEKVVINTAAVENPSLIESAAAEVGSQSVVVSIDVKQGILGPNYEVYAGGFRRTKRDPITFAKEMESAGAGEILLNSMDRDGTMQGYDLRLIESVSGAVRIPVVACGGAGVMQHFREAVQAGASAVAAGSMFVFQGKLRAVLISFPERRLLKAVFSA